MLNSSNQTTSSRTIVLVGHCGPDMYLLKGAVNRALPGARIVNVNDAETLESQVSGKSLLLINRVLDGGFDSESGIDLIRALRDRPRMHGAESPAMMLISNYPEAQAEAMEAGALRGFGKSQIYSPSTAELLRASAKP